jgi:uncharacterized protein YdiU (UPF0061 family)
MRRKIGLVSSEPGDADLANDALATMDGQSVDHTLFFRHLARAANGDTGPVLSLFDNAGQFSEWLPRWQDRLSRDPQTPESRVAAMDAVNPVYIPRNHMVEAALTAAWQDGNLAPFHDLLDVVKQPFTKRDGLDAYEGPATKDFGPYRTFCGT